MLRKPVPMTKNTILQAVQVQRKSKNEVKWVVIGLMRDGVEPTALVISQQLLLEKKWYDPKEYDVILNIGNYEEFRGVHQLTTQDTVVDFIYEKAKGWETWRRKERQAITQEPIKALLERLEVKETVRYYVGNKEIHEDVEDFDAREFEVGMLLDLLEHAIPVSVVNPTTGKREEANRVEIEYEVSVYNNQTDEYDKYDVFKLDVGVIGNSLDLSKHKFTWLLPDGTLGISKTNYQTDPIYKYLQSQKGGGK